MQKDEDVTFKGLFLPITTKKAIVFIFLIGFVVFFNSLFNPFQGDDFAQIVNNPFIKNVSSVFVYFSRGMAYSGDYALKMFHMQYRPVYYSVYTILYQFVGANSFSYHLLQLILHILTTCILFFIFSKFFKKGLAFLLSIVFLIHTFNTESVIYIGAIQDVLFVFFGLIAFYVLQINSEKKLSFKNIFSIFSLLLLSLLSKETGVAYLGVLLLFAYFFSKKNLKTITLLLVIFTIIYLLIRFFVSFNTSVDINFSLIQSASTMVRLLTLPKILYYYFSNFFIPIRLAIAQSWLVTNFSFADFITPLIIDVLFLITIFTGGLLIYKKNRNKLNLYVFFVTWFVLGLGLHFQFIPLDATVADRYFYFPIIGLLGCFGVIINSFYKEIINKVFVKNFLVISFSLFITFLTILTLIRNSQWKTEYTLLENDTKYAGSPLLDSYFGGLLILNGKVDRAKFYLERSIAEDSKIGHNFNNLAVYYEQKKDYPSAKKYYLKALEYDGKYPNLSYASYNGLAHIALLDSNFEEAIKFSQISLQKYPMNAHAMQYLAIAQYKLGNQNEALQTIKKLYDKNRDAQNGGLYQLIKENKLPFPILQNSGDVIF